MLDLEFGIREFEIGNLECVNGFRIPNLGAPIAASTAMLASGNHLSLVSHEDVVQAPSIQIGNPKSEIRNEDGLIQLWDLGFGSGDFLGRAWL